jgi:prolyl-tRNA synthetase
MSKVITPRSEDPARWYTDVVTRAELADYSPVKGCMVIRPFGYAIWEQIQSHLDARFKETGHQNAYFPLFIPETLLQREKEHVEGFSPELAVVTIGGGRELEEKLVVRPTSETIMYSMFSKWIRSYRDLPLLLNQWSNVVRWEMRTRLFLRTTEFLWQEGHTAHATEQEAEEETLRILDLYAEFAEKQMALPVLRGVKSQQEKFAGALRTYCIEAMMQDGKGLQAGTSHNLGQNFSRAFDVKFQNREGGMDYVWQTSWGVSTRLIGALVLGHGDDQGLILPPALAPIQVVIVPIWKSDEERGTVGETAAKLERSLRGAARVRADLREEVSPGFKFHEWEMKGVPLRLELGPRDLASRQVVAVSRLDRKKTPLPLDGLESEVPALLAGIQTAIHERALKFRTDHTHPAADYGQFRERLEAEGGFYEALWCGNPACEARVKEETKATIRCIPLDGGGASGTCLVCGASASTRVVYARAY